MPVNVSDYFDVRGRAQELGLREPMGITLLPRNLIAAAPDQFLYEETTTTVRSLWRQNGVSETRLEGEASPIREIVEKSFSGLVFPTIFISADLLSQNPIAVQVAINVLSDYAISFLRGLPGNGRVKLTTVVETDGDREYRSVNYEGGPEGLKDLPAIIREVNRRDYRR